MTEKTKPKKSAFGEIWEKLYNLDISAHVEKKMNLDFLSWGIAYTLMVQNYPDFEFGTTDYDGCPYQKLPNGTAQVTTWIEINGVRREMTLPVMDNKMHSTTNLDATVINKNVWRCFVKNCAIFGLGMRLYSQIKDDINDIGDAPDKEEGKAPEKLTPEQDSYPTSKEQAIDDLDLQIESGVTETIEDEIPSPDKTEEESAKLFVEASLVVVKTCKTKQECTDYYTNNSEQFKQLKLILPEDYDKVINAFKTQKEKLGE